MPVVAMRCRKPSFLADHPRHPRRLARAPLAHAEHVVEGIGNLAVHARPAVGQTRGEVAFAKGQHRGEKLQLPVLQVAVLFAFTMERRRVQDGRRLSRNGRCGFGHRKQ